MSQEHRIPSVCLAFNQCVQRLLDRPEAESVGFEYYPVPKEYTGWLVSARTGKVETMVKHHADGTQEVHYWNREKRCWEAVGSPAQPGETHDN